MSSDPIEFGGDAVQHMIALASRDAPHLVPILRQILAGGLTLVRYDRKAELAPTVLSTLHDPAMAVLPDTEGIPTGPTGWAGAESAVAWARWVIIRAREPALIDYAAIGMAAEMHRRIVLIECASGAVAEWRAAIERWNPAAHIATLLPDDGEVYPVPVAAGKLN